jgi:DNA-binding TFAR19-related protein (PDSD5 family)
MLKVPLPKTLRAIASALEALDEKELDALVAGRGKLVFVASERPAERHEASAAEAAEVLGRLSSCTDREQARAVLSEISSKEALTSLARSQKIHVTKQDRREDIESKIIEFVIGGKLRSDAIRTLNMKGASVADNASKVPM